jgi:hypothetical protein
MSEPNGRDALLSSGFPNRRRAERLLCIKSECDRLMHSEGLFIQIVRLLGRADALPPPGSDCEC